MRKVKVAALQFSCSKDVQENINKAEKMVKEAADNGAISFCFLNYLNVSISVRRSAMTIIIMHYLLKKILP